MGHIKEPDGVDFVIKSKPLTKEDELAISKFIQSYKARHPRKPKKNKRLKVAA